MPARWAFAIWGVIYVGELCAYGKILMGDAPAAVRKSTSAGWTATLFRVDGVEVDDSTRQPRMKTP